MKVSLFVFTTFFIKEVASNQRNDHENSADDPCYEHIDAINGNKKKVDTM